jgi:prepilin peptidase CpaA
MMQVAVPATLLASILGLALVTDIRARRIPNRLILAGLLLALGWHALGPPGNWTFDGFAPGSVGIVGGIVAFIATALAFLPLYALRIMGAGDVKLLAVVAAFFGVTVSAWTQLVGLSLCVLAAGGLFAMVRVALSGNGAAVAANVRILLMGYFSRATGMPGPNFDPRTDSADRMPYAFAIAAGTVFYTVAKWSGLLQVL